MSSQRRIDASRRNGARSRGPKTDAGKQTSSRNSLRHGLLAKTVVLDDEDEPAFIQLLINLEDEHQPTTQTERDLVEVMGIARWRILRLWAMERANLQEEISKDDTPDREASTRAALAFRKLADESRSADLLGRYETRYDRQYYRAFNLLLKMRKAAPNPPNENLPNEPNPENEHSDVIPSPAPSLDPFQVRNPHLAAPWPRTNRTPAPSLGPQARRWI